MFTKMPVIPTTNNEAVREYLVWSWRLSEWRTVRVHTLSL
jgi:hypothetical protein